MESVINFIGNLPVATLPQDGKTTIIRSGAVISAYKTVIMAKYF